MTDIPNEIPFNDYYEYYAPDYKLHLTPESMDNMNSKDVLESIRVELLQQLQDLQGAPSVAMHQAPPVFKRAKSDAGESNPDERETGKTRSGQHGTRKQHSAELYDNVD